MSAKICDWLVMIMAISHLTFQYVLKLSIMNLFEIFREFFLFEYFDTLKILNKSTII